MTCFEQPPGSSWKETRPLRPLLQFGHEYSEDTTRTEGGTWRFNFFVRSLTFWTGIDGIWLTIPELSWCSKWGIWLIAKVCCCRFFSSADRAWLRLIFARLFWNSKFSCLIQKKLPGTRFWLEPESGSNLLPSRLFLSKSSTSSSRKRSKVRQVDARRTQSFDMAFWALDWEWYKNNN